MLCQNWFLDERFIMFYELCHVQSFYDKNNYCIYIVEHIEEDNSNLIKELLPNSTDYNKWFEKLEEFLLTNEL